MLNFIRRIDPKVWKPAAAAVVAIAAQAIATGAFDRTELAQTLLAFGLAVIGYSAANEGTVLRSSHEDGNAPLPADAPSAYV